MYTIFTLFYINSYRWSTIKIEQINKLMICPSVSGADYFEVCDLQFAVFSHRHSLSLCVLSSVQFSWLDFSRIKFFDNCWLTSCSLPDFRNSFVGCRVFDAVGLTLWHLKCGSRTDFEEWLLNWLDIRAYKA